VTGSKGLVHWTSETWWEWNEIAGSPQGSPPSSRLRQLWSWKEVLQWAWNRDRKAAWDQVGLSHCRHEGLVMVWNEARLRRGYDDQSRRGHQCSKTSLTGESRFHISPPRGFEPRSLVTRSKGLVHWTSKTWWEWNEIAGSPQVLSMALNLYWLFPRGIKTRGWVRLGLPPPPPDIHKHTYHYGRVQGPDDYLTLCPEKFSC
jgi:hypothetical protein